MEIQCRLGKRVVDDASGETKAFVGDKLFKDQDAYSFLDANAFTSGEGVCYIPDIGFKEYAKENSDKEGFAPDTIPFAEVKARYIYDRPKIIQAFGGNERLAESIFNNMIYARPEAYKEAYEKLFGKFDGK